MVPVDLSTASPGKSFKLLLQTAGNRSMLGNDFTQVNDLGYGLIVNNGGLSEMVSQSHILLLDCLLCKQWWTD